MGVLHKHIGVGFALLVQRYRAMRRPQAVERVTVRISTLFLYGYANCILFNADAGRSIGRKIKQFMECKLNPVEVNDALKIFYKEHQGNIKFILDGKEVTPCAFSPCIVDGEYTIGDYGELLNLSITGRCNCKLDKLDNKNYYFNCVCANTCCWARYSGKWRIENWERYYFR